MWDAAGKTIKQLIAKNEYSGIQSPRVHECFVNCLEKMAVLKTDWQMLEREKDPAILQKRMFQHDKWSVGFVTEDKDELNHLIRKI